MLNGRKDSCGGYQSRIYVLFDVLSILDLLKILIHSAYLNFIGKENYSYLSKFNESRETRQSAIS